MTINSNRKGKVGERELAKELREYGYKEVGRSQQYCGVGEEASDLINLPKISPECKRVEKLNVSEAVKQAVRDCDDGKLPAVFHRKNREEWLVTMRLSDWINLYREFVG